MNLEPLREFLSEDNILAHLDWCREKRMKYSIYEKSIPEIKGKTLKEITRQGMCAEILSEVLPLICDIKSHELYFNSFCTLKSPCNELKEYYSSEAAFIYELAEYCKACDHGFVYVYKSEGRPPLITKDMKPAIGRRAISPCLAIDVCEHAYFLDYGFKKSAYINAMLERLDTSKIFSDDNCKIYLDTPI